MAEQVCSSSRDTTTDKEEMKALDNYLTIYKKQARKHKGEIPTGLSGTHLGHLDVVWCWLAHFELIAGYQHSEIENKDALLKRIKTIAEYDKKLRRL